MKIVGIHGIGNEFLSASSLESEWLPELQGGLEIAGHPRIDSQDFKMVFYGDLFRRQGTRAANIPSLCAKDIQDEWEQALLMEWWRAAAMLSEANQNEEDPLGENPLIQGPDFKGRGRTPGWVQRGVSQLAKTKFFGRMGPEKVLIFGLKQVRQFLHDPEIKQAVLQRVSEKVSPTDTQIIIGHSLGSVIAYEAICANPEWNVHTLITLGSPLATPNLVFDKLTPPPSDGVGIIPKNIRQWFNIADKGDFVALEKQLLPYFRADERQTINDYLVYNGWQSHSAKRYLTAKETGHAIAVSLTN